MPETVVLITGYLGFIGQHLVERLRKQGYTRLCGWDARTYAAIPYHQATHVNRDETLDICTARHLPDIDVVINLAAASHVDHSIMDPGVFWHTNTEGVRNLLELIRGKRQYQVPRFIQISTDEVYGDEYEIEAYETSMLAPSSPYAASKAAADLLVMAYGRTFGIPWNIIRPSNCYGRGQYHEKLIPKAVRHLALGRPIPVHGDGLHRRTWLKVEDCASAIQVVLERAPVGQIYNVGGNSTLAVKDVVEAVAESYGGVGHQIQYGFDRAGIDRYYRVDDSKLRQLGWEPEGHFLRDLPAIVEWERGQFRW
jgi:dTDP-glucose 4,6-dehydratase